MVSRRTFVLGILGGAVIASSWPALAAQDQPAATLRKDGRTYYHDPSKSQFTVPEKWTVQPAEPQVSGTTVTLTVRLTPPKGLPGPVTEVQISWSPLVLERDETLALEVAALEAQYPGKVGKPEAFQLNDKPGFKITVDGGPNSDGKDLGIVYLFAEGTNGWKIKARANFPRMNQAESTKAIDALLPSLQWKSN
jgi:hypothetical protein